MKFQDPYTLFISYETYQKDVMNRQINGWMNEGNSKAICPSTF